MAGLAGGDQLGLRRLPLPVGELLGAGIDQEDDRIRTLGGAGELGGDADGARALLDAGRLTVVAAFERS